MKGEMIGPVVVINTFETEDEVIAIRESKRHRIQVASCVSQSYPLNIISRQS